MSFLFFDLCGLTSSITAGRPRKAALHIHSVDS